ncbi:MAG: fibronectin type III domain-containing protein [Saprospiraceae bacterium]
MNLQTFPVFALVLSIGCFSALPASGQFANPEVLEIAASGIFTADQHVLLRWTPANLKTWAWCRDSGYLLVRVTLEDTNGPLPGDEQSASIVQKTFLPKDQAAWEAAMLIDSIVGVAAGAYYGEDFTVASPDNEGIVTAHNIESEEENRFGMSLFAADVSTLAAEMQNLLFRDTTAQQGFRYAYIIRPGGQTGDQLLRPGRVIMSTDEVYVAPTPASFNATPGDSLAVLVWDQFATAGHYAGYNIWRSQNGGPFEQLNTEPVIATEGPDGKEPKALMFYARLENNTDSFSFRICGHSPFGFDGPFSETLTVKGVPAPLRAGIGISRTEETTAGMEIHWAFPDSLNASIQGFQVLRSGSHDGNYALLPSGMIAASERSFVDLSPLPAAYYKVAFTDVNGNEVTSNPQLAQLRDSIPPEPPGQVTGEAVGQSGLLRIHWSPGNSGDVMGYRVFMADQPDGAYGQVSKRWVRDTVFTYQVNVSSLTPYKYFRVKAIDHRENTSGFSPVCAVALPDIVPPSMPVLKQATPQGGGILISFAPSQSADILQHHILRKKKDERDWQSVAVLDSLWGHASAEFLDTTAEQMYTYEYMIQAEDGAGLKSNSRVFRAKQSAGGARETVGQLEAQFVKSEGTIRLRWSYHNAYGVTGFAIYRGPQPDQLYESGFVTAQQSVTGGQYDGPDPFQTDASGMHIGDDAGNAVSGGHLPAGSFDLKQKGAPNTTHTTFCEYRDRSFLNFKPYYYAVIVKYADGTFSPMSNVVSASAY